MPERMKAEVVAVSPLALQAIDPSIALARPACHLEDVRDGVRGPDVGGIAIDGLPPGALRRGVITGLFQTEGVTADNKAVARYARVPGRQGTRQHVAHALALAGIEPAVLPQLQCQDVARMLNSNFLPARRGAGEIALHPGCQGRHMRCLAWRGTSCAHGGLRRLERALCPRHHRSLSEEHHEIAAQA